MIWWSPEIMHHNIIYLGRGCRHRLLCRRSLLLNIIPLFPLSCSLLLLPLKLFPQSSLFILVPPLFFIIITMVIVSIMHSVETSVLDLEQKLEVIERTIAIKASNHIVNEKIAESNIVKRIDSRSRGSYFIFQRCSFYSCPWSIGGRPCIAYCTSPITEKEHKFKEGKHSEDQNATEIDSCIRCVTNPKSNELKEPLQWAYCHCSNGTVKNLSIVE